MVILDKSMLSAGSGEPSGLKRLYSKVPYRVAASVEALGFWWNIPQHDQYLDVANNPACVMAEWNARMNGSAG